MVAIASVAFVASVAFLASVVASLPPTLSD